MKNNKMVIRFKDGTLIKGQSSDFFPSIRLFQLACLNGTIVTIDLKELKAIFFVKSFQGNEHYIYKYEDVISWGINKMKIDFIDHESMIGYAQHYKCLSHHVYYSQYGFFITPADFKGNNNRVFVLNSAIEKITFLQNSPTNLPINQTAIMPESTSGKTHKWLE
jgi:hypothetical protein